MSVVVTGGAGFIGSCVVRALNDKGIDDIVIVDNILKTEKWMNLRNKRYITYVNRDDFLLKLQGRSFGEIEAIIHLGACSSTTELDFDYLWKNNVEYTKALWNYCADNDAQFIYASSASTYGGGERGFDDRMPIDDLLPLNGYGYSKQAFDKWAQRQIAVSAPVPKQHVGLKFFNVYGPNEYNKGSMASMVYHGYKQVADCGEIRLFKSYNPAYADGDQMRDFVYVKDVVSVILWFYDNPQASGLYNVGSGHAQSFKELAEATFHALGIEPNIRYIDMPELLRAKYQYHTEAELTKLRSIGYMAAFSSVEEGVRDYVQNYLEHCFLVW